MEDVYRNRADTRNFRGFHVRLSLHFSGQLLCTNLSFRALWLSDVSSISFISTDKGQTPCGQTDSRQFQLSKPGREGMHFNWFQHPIGFICTSRHDSMHGIYGLKEFPSVSLSPCKNQWEEDLDIPKPTYNSSDRYYSHFVHQKTY